MARSNAGIEQRSAADLSRPEQKLGSSADLLRGLVADSLTPAAQTEQVRATGRRISQQARVSGLRAEEMLVEIKQLWSSIPEHRDIGNRRKQEQVLSELIRTCIVEFYADGGR